MPLKEKIGAWRLSARERGFENKLGKDLEVGDIVAVWWTPRLDEIGSLDNYNQDSEIWRDGRGRIARFPATDREDLIQDNKSYAIVKREVRDGD